eukprot:8195091-Karenia_brevis.AAC.1
MTQHGQMGSRMPLMGARYGQKMPGVESIGLRLSRRSGLQMRTMTQQVQNWEVERLENAMRKVAGLGRHRHRWQMTPGL